MKVKTDLEISGHLSLLLLKFFGARKLFGLNKYYSK